MSVCDGKNQNKGSGTLLVDNLKRKLVKQETPRVFFEITRPSLGCLLDPFNRPRKFRLEPNG